MYPRTQAGALQVPYTCLTVRYLTLDVVSGTADTPRSLQSIARTLTKSTEKRRQETFSFLQI